MDKVTKSVKDFAKLMADGEQYQRDVSKAFEGYVDDAVGWGEWCARMQEWIEAQ